jgi:DNA mismatch repair protein MLH1
VCREELFYQLGLRQFGDMPRIKLQPSPPLMKLLEIAVNAEEISPGQTSLSKSDIVKVDTLPYPPYDSESERLST